MSGDKKPPMRRQRPEALVTLTGLFRSSEISRRREDPTATSRAADDDSTAGDQLAARVAIAKGEEVPTEESVGELLTMIPSAAGLRSEADRPGAVDQIDGNAFQITPPADATEGAGPVRRAREGIVSGRSRSREKG
jgi:hypothetical protein